MGKSPPRKTTFSSRRDREFLYLPEVDALIAATQKPALPLEIRRSLSCYSARPYNQLSCAGCESCDVNFAENILLVTRNRSLSARDKNQILVNLQALCPPEIDLLEQLYQQRTTDWVFALLAKTTPEREISASYNSKCRCAL